MTNAPGPDEQGGFYVGYLRMPPALAWFIRGLILVLVVLVGLDAALVLGLQQKPGSGVWSETLTRFEGAYVDAPYPMLVVRAGDGSLVPHLIVADSKRGGLTVSAGLKPGPMRITGVAVERPGPHGVKMIEAAEGAFEVLPSTQSDALPAPQALGEAALKGEIVDSKCWLGVMRPGAGPVHKGCAQICLLGGIPPMLLTRMTDGSQRVYLLVTPNGDAWPADRASALAGYPLTLSGNVERWGPMVVLRAAVPASVIAN